ncbi:MaoC/PaaZ C-terminal domain-containing protein [Streptomyces sp. NPDC058424]|uniref:MaoC/PaaZ C-terminal domain-containing protein n=1 Tax=Streptomyces sp. NPDC058424 TaxID=3346491 RepID=UPI00365DDCE6
MRQPIQAKVGDRVPERVIGPVTQTDIVRFAGAGGDFNPLHHDPEFARSSGFSGVISMGQMQAGILAGWLSDWVGVEHLREYEVRFAVPVFLGDVLHLSGEVVEITTRDGVSTACIALGVDRAGETVVKASAQAVVTAA